MPTSSGTSGSRILGAGRTTPLRTTPLDDYFWENVEIPYPPSPHNIPPPHSPTVSRPFSPKTRDAWEEYFEAFMRHGFYPNLQRMSSRDVAAFYRSQGQTYQDSTERAMADWQFITHLPEPPPGGRELMGGIGHMRRPSLGSQGSTTSDLDRINSARLGSTSAESRTNQWKPTPRVRRTMPIDPVGVLRTSSGGFRASQGNRPRRESSSSSAGRRKTSGLSPATSAWLAGAQRARAALPSRSRSGPVEFTPSLSGTPRGTVSSKQSTIGRRRRRSDSDSSYDLRPSPSTSRSSTGTSAAGSATRSVRRRPNPTGQGQQRRAGKSAAVRPVRQARRRK